MIPAAECLRISGMNRAELAAWLGRPIEALDEIIDGYYRLRRKAGKPL